MGRPLGSKNKNKADGAAPKEKKAPAQQPAGAGHNVPSDDQLHALTKQHAEKRKDLLAAEKKTKADRMNFDKIIKSDLGDKGLANIKLMALLDTPEGEAEFKADKDREMMVARWMGVSIGTQASLFDDDRRPVDERAFDQGKRDGLSGKTFINPHAPGAPGHDPYANGWRVGQDALFAIKKPVAAPEAEVIKGPDHQEASEPDEFDAAAEGAPIAQTAKAWPDDEQVAAQQENKPEGATVN